MSNNNIEKYSNLFASFGFSPTEVRRLAFAYNRYKDNFSSQEDLEENYKRYHDNMIRLGYQESELHELASIHPKAMFQKFKNGNLEEYYKKYLDREKNDKLNKYYRRLAHLKREEREEISAEEKIELNRSLLLTFDVPKDKVAGILKSNLPLAEMHPDDLLSNLYFYLNCSITREELLEIINSNSTVLLYGINEYNILFKDFHFLSSSDLGKMVLFYSKHNTIVQPDCLYKTLNFAVQKRLNKPRLIRWLKKNLIKNLDEEELKDAFDNLIKIGFKEEQARYAASESLSILHKEPEKIEYIIEVARMYAVSKENIISIITGFPALTDLQENMIKEKIAVMTRYNLTDYVVSHPKSLIEGAELIDARAFYLRTFQPRVDGSEFASAIFSQESAFKKKYDRPNDYIKDLRKLLKR